MAKMVKYINNELIEYDLLSLVDFYDPILRTPTKPIDFSTALESDITHLLYSLSETLSKMEGLGLSANQVGISKRACAVNMGEKIWVMFNPYIVEKSETISKYSEGCLSYPGLYLNLNRSNHIKVKFQAAGGQEVVKEFDGLTAVVIQHELDHLDGVVFTEKVSPIKLDQAKRKTKTILKKMKRAQAPVPEDIIQQGISELS